MGVMMEKIQWQISVPIFRNTVILRQLGIAIGIPFGLIALIVGLASGKSVYAFYVLGTISALLFLTPFGIIFIGNPDITARTEFTSPYSPLIMSS
jgi:hypothetical protein